MAVYNRANCVFIIDVLLLYYVYYNTNYPALLGGSHFHEGVLILLDKWDQGPHFKGSPFSHDTGLNVPCNRALGCVHMPALAT